MEKRGKMLDRDIYHEFGSTGSDVIFLNIVSWITIFILEVSEHKRLLFPHSTSGERSTLKAATRKIQIDIERTQREFSNNK